jgi:hypothetical protein
MLSAGKFSIKRLLAIFRNRNENAFALMSCRRLCGLTPRVYCSRLRSIEEQANEIIFSVRNRSFASRH